MAIIAHRARSIWLAVNVLIAAACMYAGAVAQTAEAVRPLDPESFVRLAHSSAVLQTQAAELAATKNTRPEARAYAERMLEFRRRQIGSLERAASENGIRISAVKQFEHQVLIDNLEPLDSVELSRRYAELQVQALRQELQVYAGGERTPVGWVKGLTTESLPNLHRLLADAEEMRKAVGP